MTDLEIQGFLPRAQRCSVIDAARLTSLMRLTSDAVTRDVPGDVVECGVAHGGSASAMARVIRDTDRHCWLYDSFEGLPAPSEEDGPIARRFTGENASSVESVYQALDGAKFPLDRAHIEVGWFLDSFTRSGPDAIVVLHIDADWYASVAAALMAWYHRVSVGGYVVLDDFGCWPGCRQAFYEFVGMRALRPDLMRVGDQAWWRKEEEG